MIKVPTDTDTNNNNEIEIGSRLAMDATDFKVNATLANLLNGLNSEALQYDDLEEYLEEYTTDKDVYYPLFVALLQNITGLKDDDIDELVKGSEESYKDAVEVLADALGDKDPYLIVQDSDLAFLDEFVLEDLGDGEELTILDWFVGTKSEVTKHIKAAKADGLNLTENAIYTTKIDGTAKKGYEAVNEKSKSQKGTAPSQVKGAGRLGNATRTDQQIERHQASMAKRASMMKKKQARSSRDV